MEGSLLGDGKKGCGTGMAGGGGHREMDRGGTRLGLAGMVRVCILQQ